MRSMNIGAIILSALLIGAYQVRKFKKNQLENILQ